MPPFWDSSALILIVELSVCSFLTTVSAYSCSLQSTIFGAYVVPLALKNSPVNLAQVTKCPCVSCCSYGDMEINRTENDLKRAWASEVRTRSSRASAVRFFPVRKPLNPHRASLHRRSGIRNSGRHSKHGPMCVFTRGCFTLARLAACARARRRAPACIRRPNRPKL